MGEGTSDGSETDVKPFAYPEHQEEIYVLRLRQVLMAFH